MKRDFDDPHYKAARNAVYKRDRGKCQYPDCKERKRLHVHHILPYADHHSLRLETSNLILLCKAHHEYITGSELIFAKLFNEIVTANEKRLNNARNKRFKRKKGL